MNCLGERFMFKLYLLFGRIPLLVAVDEWNARFTVNGKCPRVLEAFNDRDLVGSAYILHHRLTWFSDYIFFICRDQAFGSIPSLQRSTLSEVSGMPTHRLLPSPSRLTLKKSSILSWNASNILSDFLKVWA